MPKSSATRLPAGSTNRLPWCISAWKKPSRMAWRRNDWITLSPSALRSSPRARSASTSAIDVPSIHSVVSTRLLLRPHSTCGTRKPLSSLEFCAISESAAASMRRSNSCTIDSSSMATAATGRSLRDTLLKRSAFRAAKAKLFMSLAKRRSTSGRRIFTATSLPSKVTALCTCAIEAAATDGPKDLNNCATGLPNSAATIASASACGNGGNLSCRAFNSKARLAPITSGRVAKNCPSLI